MRYQITAKADGWRSDFWGFVGPRNTITTVRERAVIFDGARALQQGVKEARERHGDLYEFRAVFPRAIDERENAK